MRLSLDVAVALGDTEEERAAADVLVSQSASLEFANAQLAAAAVQTPRELARAREALARAPLQSPNDAAAHAAREREADDALRAATTTTAFRLAQARQLTVHKILWSRSDLLVRMVSGGFARLLIEQRLEEFKLAQAESAARFALRHYGQNRLQGATRALAAAITALRAERDKLDRAVNEIFADVSAMSISPQPVTLSASSTTSGATTSGATTIVAEAARGGSGMTLSLLLATVAVACLALALARS
jgi:hypothetical protein